MKSKYLVVFAILLGQFSCKNIGSSDQLFSQLSSSDSGIKFKNNLLEKKAFGILYYLYYFNGGGVSIGDINNDGLQDIYFTANNKSSNKLYLNKGNLKFEDITEKAKVAGSSDWCTGSTMADVNGDGLLDIYISAMAQQHGLKGHNELFINKGDNTFEEKSAEYGLDFSGFSTQSAFFDYDHDGDLDCYLLNQSQQPNQNIRPSSGRSDFSPLAGDRFYKNENGNKFTDVSKTTGIYQSDLGYGLGISVADFNNDGFEDVYIGNDFHENDYYYLNNQKGGFVESGEKHFRHYSRFSMGNDAGDYNNDGQMDLISVDMLPDNEKNLKTYGSDEQFDNYQYKILSNGYQYQFSRNCLQQNNGDGQSFSEVGLMAGVSATDWSWCPLFVDFDNDAKKDLFISSGIVKRPVDLDYVKYVSSLFMTKGMDKTDIFDKDALSKMPDGSSHPFFFRGDGDGNFSDVSDKWGTSKMKGYFNGSAYGDLDNDGDIDVVINNIGQEATVLKNNSKKEIGSISVAFEGENLNKFGIGAKTYLFSNGTFQYQQLIATHGFQSSSQNLLHFGTGNAKIDSILVVWPSQKYQVIRNPKIQQKVICKEKDAKGSFSSDSFFPKKTEFLENITSQININWKHNENLSNDFSIQPLLSHKWSSRGPKLAIGDVNGDGLDDFYACGAKGQPGVMMVQQQNGGFKNSSESTFKQDASYEDVDAVIFDANNDKKPDVLVVSGGNELENGKPELADRLYLNDGKGNFIKSNNFPQILETKGNVAVADIDKDGDVDVFIGGASPAASYGTFGNSNLLLNDGKGNFSPASENIIKLKKLGIVTSAAFGDLNKDGFPDLVVGGEYMPITIFENKNGKFASKTIENTNGWWQKVSVMDINQDGYLDILGGNWGINNKYCSNKDGKVKLYVKDFDKNGNMDQLLSYSIQGKEYPFLAKDEIERPLPVLRTHYKLYTDYAGLEMKDAFYGFVEQVEPLMADQLKSMVFLGDKSGNFKSEVLPYSLQKAPIFGFEKISEDKYLVGGNFYDVQPYEGRYDAQPLAIFSSNKNGLKYLHQPNLYNFNGQVRDIKILRTGQNKKVVIAAFNDKPIEVFSIK